MTTVVEVLLADGCQVCSLTQFIPLSFALTFLFEITLGPRYIFQVIKIDDIATLPCRIVPSKVLLGLVLELPP